MVIENISYKEYKAKYGSPNRFALLNEEEYETAFPPLSKKDNIRNAREDINRNVTRTSYYNQKPRTIPNKLPIVDNQPSDQWLITILPQNTKD